MTARNRPRSRVQAAVLWTALGVFTAGSLAAQTAGSAVTNLRVARIPHSNATPDRLASASVRLQSLQPGSRRRTPIAAAPVPADGSGPSPGPLGPGPGCNLFPAPASTGASVGLSYFGPPPSASNPSLVGPYQLLQSGKVDEEKGTITLPLYKGYLRVGNVPVWYILTDVDDLQVSTLLGLNYSAKLTNSGPGARTGSFNENGDVIFDNGRVDFRPERVLVPGPPEAPFPPAISQPGSLGDLNYSPLVRLTNAGGIIYNAPIVAFGVEASEINFPNGSVDYRMVHDQVIAIDPNNETVTMNLINGFSFGRPLWYLSTDASTAMVAAIEGNTYAPLLASITTGKDDSFSSAVERIFIATNGAMDCDNPQRQGLFASLTDGFRPNNTFGGVPTIATDYSPLWNGQLYEWTPDSVAKGYRGQLREEFQILTYVQDGLITGPSGAPFGDSKFIINCPPVQRLQ